METEKDTKANILIEVDGAVMHRFVEKEKNLYTSGTCKIAKIDSNQENPVYFMNINSFFYTLSKTVIFAKMEFEDTASYLFSHFDNGMSTLTIPRNDQIIHHFDQILKDIVDLKLYNLAVCDEEFARKVQVHCPNITQEPIVINDRVKSTIRYTGKILENGFKIFGDCLVFGVHKIGETIQNKINEPLVKPEVNPKVKQRWATLKNGTNKMIDVSKNIYTKYLAPIVQFGVESCKNLSNKIDHSNNQKAKYAKDLVCASGSAACDVFHGFSDGAGKVLKELSSQSRKIMNKKLGDDYVKTFLPGENADNKQNTPDGTRVELKQKQNQQNSGDRLLDKKLD